MKKAPARKLLTVAVSLSSVLLLGWIGYRVCCPSNSKYEVVLTNHPQTKVIFNIPDECEVGSSGSARQQEFFTLKFAQPSLLATFLSDQFNRTALPETISSDEVRIWVDDFPDTFTHDQIKSLKSRVFEIKQTLPKIPIASHYTQEEIFDRIITIDRFEYKAFNGVPFLRVIYQVYRKQADGKYSRLIDTDFCLPKEKGLRFDTTLCKLLRTVHETKGALN